MSRIDPFAGTWERDRHHDVYVYNDQTFAGRWRRGWYRVFWRHWPW